MSSTAGSQLPLSSNLARSTGDLSPIVYLYDGMDIGSNVIEELDNAGNVLARYAQSPGMDHPLAEARSGTTSYHEQDALSSVTSLSNVTGGLARTYSYDSFGMLTGSTGTLLNPFQYSGREFDAETGVFYNRYRYYDPSIGRFLGEDPTEFGAGNDFYVYVKNNPVLWIDPWGLVRCSYTIAAHNLHCVSDDFTQVFDTSRARSGRGLCMNNSFCTGRPFQGPIPIGVYFMGPMGGTPNPHRVPRVWLSPWNNSITFGRGSFEVHQGNDNSSSGCIVLDPDEYDRFRRFYAVDDSGVTVVQ
jgi:RHS repeat-associated protein